MFICLRKFASPTVRSQQKFVKPLFVVQRLFIRGTNTSAFLSSLRSGKVPTRTDKQTSLAWVRLYDYSPASYGIRAFDGSYLELIPPKLRLPCEKSATMVSPLDYMRSVAFGICYRQSMLDTYVEIADDAVLNNIRLAKRGEAKFRVTMQMDKNLTGNFSAQDTWTKSKVSIDFDGRLIKSGSTPQPKRLASPSSVAET